MAAGVSAFTDWLVSAVSGFTGAITNLVSNLLLNPLQSLLADSPWWLMALVLLALAYLLGGWRPTVIALVCELVILGTGLWNESMKTLTTTLVATLAVIVIAVVVGVWMGRNRRADTVVRPFLDAFQTIPPFVYLVPALALFGTGRFTAIVAAFAYGVPVATKLIADGIRGVSPTSVEAARAAGTTAWQMISKVQLPMARAAVVLASNQGLLYVLSMVVIGGLVGGGGLGYYVVAGFSQSQLFGKGLAAGIAITALGVMLDRNRPIRRGPLRPALIRRNPVELRAVRRAALAAVLGLTLAACGGGNIQNAPAPSGGGEARPRAAASSTWRSTRGSATRRPRTSSATSPRASSAATSSTRTSRKRSPGRAWATARSTW